MQFERKIWYANNIIIINCVDLVKLSCSCIVPLKYIVENVLNQTDGQILILSADGESNIIKHVNPKLEIEYPTCFCKKRLTEADMQIMFRKAIYDKIKTFSHEYLKQKSTRLQAIIDYSGLKTREKLTINCRDLDLATSKEIQQSLEINPNLRKLVLSKGKINEEIIKGNTAFLLSKIPNLQELKLKDINISKNSLRALADILNQSNIQVLEFNNTAVKAQDSFEYIGAIIWQSKVHKLILRNAGLTDYGLIYLAEPISKSENLHHLDLSFNNITTIGLKQIEENLKDNKHLQYLKIRQKVYGLAFHKQIKNLRTVLKQIDIDSY